MKKIICFITLLLLSNTCLAASSSGDGDSKNNLYNGAKKLILRAKKLEKKDKTEKALKLYSKAIDPKHSVFIDEAMHNNLYDFKIEKEVLKFNI